jgi:hypothetical protein
MKTSKLSLALVTLGFVMVAASSFAGAHHPAPEAGSTALLMSVGFAGLAAVKRFMR